MKVSRHGHPLGIHRVLDRVPVLPQGADQLDAGLPIYDNEILIDVECLNIDSASFHQMEEFCHGDEEKLADHMLQIVRTRGKMQNSVTGSGGVLVGTVREIGENYCGTLAVKRGDAIVTLVSLTLMPLAIEEILAVDNVRERVYIKGHAILFASGLAVQLPDDLPRGVVLAALDVCGAPAHAARLIQKGDKVLVIGGGKSGKLVLAQAKKVGAQTICVEYDAVECERIKDLDLAEHVFHLDARNAVVVAETVTKAAGGEVDVAFSCANVADTEMAAILPVRQGGTAMFFSMATNFSKSVLGTEGIGRDVLLLMGNGYVPGHASLTLDLLRSSPELLRWFEENYAVDQG